MKNPFKKRERVARELTMRGMVLTPFGPVPHEEKRFVVGNIEERFGEYVKVKWDESEEGPQWLHKDFLIFPDTHVRQEASDRWWATQLSQPSSD